LGFTIKVGVRVMNRDMLVNFTDRVTDMVRVRAKIRVRVVVTSLQ